MNKILYASLLLCSTTLHAQENGNFQHKGVITAVPEESGTIVISNQTYTVDLNTQIHGMMPGGELGPTPTIGSEVGFNIQLRDDIHYISDLWPLEDDDD